jgi:hypothetical protein
MTSIIEYRTISWRILTLQQIVEFMDNFILGEVIWIFKLKDHI